MDKRIALQLHIVGTGSKGGKLLFSLLPPLALYAALIAVFTRLLDLASIWIALLPGGAAACLCSLPGRRWARIPRLVIFLCAGLALALLPMARVGLIFLAHRLFAASEAVNAYVYRQFSLYFTLSSIQASAALRLAWVLLGVLLGTLCSLCSHRLCVLLLFLGMAFLEAHFGITPGIWLNLLLFTVLALLLVLRPGNEKGEAAFLAGIAVVFLSVLLLVPSPLEGVESWSEHLRDALGAAALRIELRVEQAEQEKSLAHQESRQHEELTDAEEAHEGHLREYEKRQEAEQEISLPHRTDYLRIVFLLLLVVVLLIGPFLPFLLLTRAKRRREERQAAFSDADNEAAVRAMFNHIVDWLRESGLKTENRPYSQCQAAVEALTDSEYAAKYGETVQIWQEAVYSDHLLTDEQRRTVRELLDATAATLYARADRRTRFRMKYIRCLCGS